MMRTRSGWSAPGAAKRLRRRDRRVTAATNAGATSWSNADRITTRRASAWSAANGYRRNDAGALRERVATNVASVRTASDASGAPALRKT